MWISFFVACIVALCLLYVPGVLSLTVFGVKARSVLMLISPLISVAEYELFCLLSGFTVVSCSSYSLIIWFILFGIICLFTSRIINKASEEAVIDINFKALFLYLAVSSAITVLFFIVPLDGPDSFNQDHDNVWHLNLIESFCNMGNMNPFSASVYGSVLKSPYLSLGSFYPAAWHSLCAFVCEFVSVSPAIAANAVNSVILACLFPVSMFSLMSVLFKENSKALYCGSFFSLAFSFCPWGFLVFGPLYPNLFGQALLPLFLTLVLLFFEMYLSVRSVFSSLLLIAGIGSLALAHTNSLICAFLFLFLFYLCSIWEKRLKPSKKYVVIVVSTICFLAFWFLLYRSPFLAAQVKFNWPASQNLVDAIISVFSFRVTDYPSSSILVLFVLVGWACVVRKPGLRSICLAFVISFILLVVSVGTDGFIKQFLTGFWYTDPYRLAANMVIPAIPLASYGLSVFFDFVSTIICSRKRLICIKACAVISLFILLFGFSKSIDGNILGNSPFGSIEYKLSDLNDQSVSHLFDAGEQRFVMKAKKIVGDNLVLNSPEDGSFFAYSLASLNVYYRQPGLTNKGPQSQASYLIKNKLYQYANNNDVKRAVKSISAKYVLLLDQGGEITADRHTYGYYKPNEWQGFNRITDSTLGFKCVLSEGDMRLYRIVE